MAKYRYQEYALYKGDKFIYAGTAKEIAEKANIKPKTIQWMSTPAYKNRIMARKKYDNAQIVIKLDYSEE